MIDFAKLNDPDVRRRMKELHEKRQAEFEEHEGKIKAAVALLVDDDVIEKLTDKERAFVRSCESRVRRFDVLSGAQERWLFDLSATHGGPSVQPHAGIPGELAEMPCTRCGGSGKHTLGACFTCNGRGSLTGYPALERTANDDRKVAEAVKFITTPENLPRLLPNEVELAKDGLSFLEERKELTPTQLKGLLTAEERLRAADLAPRRRFFKR